MHAARTSRVEAGGYAKQWEERMGDIRIVHVDSDVAASPFLAKAYGDFLGIQVGTAHANMPWRITSLYRHRLDREGASVTRYRHMPD